MTGCSACMRSILDLIRLVPENAAMLTTPHEEDAFCQRCEDHVLVHSREPNHPAYCLVMFGLLALAVLAGPAAWMLAALWFAGWIAVGLIGGTPLRCSRCGSVDLFE